MERLRQQFRVLVLGFAPEGAVGDHGLAYAARVANSTSR
jgi:hypothetical protein